MSSPLNYGTPSSLGSVRTPRSTIHETPIRLRPDLRMERRIRTVNVDSEHYANSVSNYQVFCKWITCEENVFTLRKFLACNEWRTTFDRRRQ